MYRFIMLEQRKSPKLKYFLLLKFVTYCHFNETDTFPNHLLSEMIANTIITPERNWSQRYLQRRCLPKVTHSSVFILEPVPVDALQLKRHQIHSFAPSCPYFSLQEENYITLKTKLILKNVLF